LVQSQEKEQWVHISISNIFLIDSHFKIKIIQCSISEQSDTQIAHALNIIGATAHQKGLPWLVWQIVPNTRSGDLEFFIGERTAWAAFEHQAC